MYIYYGKEIVPRDHFSLNLQPFAGEGSGWHVEEWANEQEARTVWVCRKWGLGMNSEKRHLEQNHWPTVTWDVLGGSFLFGDATLKTGCKLEPWVPLLDINHIWFLCCCLSWGSVIWAMGDCGHYTGHPCSTDGVEEGLHRTPVSQSSHAGNVEDPRSCEQDA